MTYSFVSRDRCPLCGSGSTRVVFRKGFDEPPVSRFIRDYYRVDPSELAGGDYVLVRCERCTLLYQGMVGDDRLLEQVYGVWIKTDSEADPQYRDAISAIPQSRDGHEIMAASKCLGVPLTGLTTLDYGMGWALWARCAQALGCRSYGTELSPVRAEFARNHGVTVLSDEEIAPSTFHFINTEQVFEHVTQPGDLARRLGRALVPGGILKVSVPSGDRADRIVEALDAGADFELELVMPVQPLEHVNCFTSRSIQLLAAAAGLEVYRPPLAGRYTFLRHASAVPFTRPAKLVKELVRPIYQFHNRRNLYRWLRKPALNS